MKRPLLILRSLLLLCALIVGSSYAWADDELAFDFDCSNNVTLASKGLSTTSTSNNYTVKQTISSTQYTWKLVTNQNNGSFSVAKNQDALQLGSSNNPVGNYTLTLQTSLSNISEIVVTAYSNNSSTLSAGVGTSDGTISTSFKIENTNNTSVTTTTTATTYTFVPTSSVTGNVIISGNNAAKYIRIKDITITYNTSSGGSTPSISADNVNIAYNATEGSIEYTLNNATGNVTAATTSDWLTLGAVTASEIPFTCSSNTGAERTATVTLSFEGATDKVVTITQNAAPYTVTIETPTNGTLSVKLKSDNSVVTSGSQHAAGTVLIITATPDEGYNFKNIQVVDPTTHTFTNSNIREYTLLAANTTIKANFEAKVYHNVNWYVNGSISSTVPVEVGTAIAKPATNPESIVGKRFVGWTASTIDGTTNTAPTFFTAANMGTEDVNYYAVFATVETEDPDTYAKITSSTLDTNETYVLGAEQSTTVSTMWYFYDYDNVDKNTDWGKSTSTPATVSPLKLTLSGTSSALVVKDENGKYLEPWKGNFRMMNASTYATISIDANGVLSGTSHSDNTTTVNLRYNHNNGSGGFRWYDGTTGTQAYLYKVIPGTTYSHYRTTVPTTATITLNAACTDGDYVYGTYSNSFAFVVSDDIEVSEVGVVDGKIVVDSYATGAVVPANTGVMVAALAGGNYNVTLSAEAGTSVLGSDNKLKPSGDAGIDAEGMAAAASSCKYYRLTMHNGTDIGFWWGAENGAAFNLAANKAYLAVPTGAGARSGLWFGDNDATAIGDALRLNDKGEMTNDSYFNLAGQRVAQPTKGLYIVNGKKVVIK